MAGGGICEVEEVYSRKVFLGKKQDLTSFALIKNLQCQERE
jgi:hypothetical protein